MNAAYNNDIELYCINKSATASTRMESNPIAEIL